MTVRYSDLMAKMRDQAPDLAATRTRRASAPTSAPTSAPVFHADDKTKRRRKGTPRRLTKRSKRGSLKKMRARTAPRRARETTRRRTVAKQSRAQRRASLANLRKAHAKRRGRRRASESKGQVRRNTAGKFSKTGRKVAARFTGEARRRRRSRRAYEAPRRRRRHYARAAEAPRRRRRAGRRRHYVKGHYSHEARRRSSRRRRHYAREFAGEARRRRGRRHSRRYRGALENPLSGMELAITILTGSVGYMAAEIADRYMAIRKGAPGGGKGMPLSLAVNDGKAPQLPMYKDWPRLLVAVGITGAPLVASAFIKSPTWRSALQTMGIGAGLRTVGNILVGAAAQLTMPSADKSQTPAEAQKNIFAFEQSLETAYDAWNKQTADQKAAQEKAYEAGLQGLPQNAGTGACPTCKRTDGLGACCGRMSQQPPQQQAPLPPPPPITAPPQAGPPAVSMTPPMVPQAPYNPPAISVPGTPPPGYTPPGMTVPGNPPPAIAQQPPTSMIPGPRGVPPMVSAPPVSAFAPFPAGGGVRGIPSRFMAGTGSVAPRPNFNWGHQGRSEDAAE
jgi:hypothetical protein